jgi:hypothetical protein
VNPQKLADHFRKEAAYYRQRTEYLKDHAPFQTVSSCPGCNFGTRGGSLCPGCLEALAELIDPTKEPKP